MMLHSPLSFDCVPPPSSHAFPSPLRPPSLSCHPVSSLSLVPLRARADSSSLRRSASLLSRTGTDPSSGPPQRAVLSHPLRFSFEQNLAKELLLSGFSQARGFCTSTEQRWDP